MAINKIIKSKISASKKGAVSLYIVVFTTILFGVIALSFLRIVLSESSSTSHDDLSRSAYDAAMAGVEDAKTAVNKYYSCLASAGKTPATCDYVVLFDDRCDNSDGIGLARYLYKDNYTGGEVLIQQNSVGSSADNNSNQAYTCVILSDVVQDYRGTLTSDTRTKVVPLRIYDGGTDASSATIQKVDFEWFSSLNEGTERPDGLFNTDNGLSFESDTNKTVPPTIQLTYIKVGPNINIDNFHQANSNGFEYSTMVIIPNGQSQNGATTVISADDRARAGNISAGVNSPFGATCSTTKEFACKVSLNETNIGANETAFLIVSLPYKETVSDFAVTLYDGDSKVLPFEGVQISVDSTGRTDTLVRRVESRLDPADLFFPYPQYALELSNPDGGDALKKNFWITANCWFSQPSTGGVATQCNNNGNIGG